MSNGQNPLVLMMALSLPSAAHALGLGDIHVDSKLNEPLAANIDIVGASAEELAALRVAVANRETFVRYGADRPAFLSSTTFRVTHDSFGHPVLAVRSGESFTEPVVNFLIDLRWDKGELIREYTLLLDPAVFAPASRAADAASAPAVQTLPAAKAAAAVETAPNAEAPPAVQSASAGQSAPAAQATSAAQSSPVDPAGPVAAASVIQTAATLTRNDGAAATFHKSSRAKSAGPKMTHYKVGARATLRGIAWRVGARSESDLQRLMIAIFRANPAAFDDNINRLHRGALLSIPGTAEVSAISTTEAKREIRAQMAAWHSPGRVVAHGATSPSVAPPETRPAPVAADAAPAAAAAAVAATATATPAARADATAMAAPAASAAAVATAATTATADEADSQALSRRVQSLEQELHEMQRLLESEHAKLLGVQMQVGRVENSAPAETSTPADTALPTRDSGPTRLGSIGAGLGVLAGALAGLYFWLRRRSLKSIDSRNSHAAVEDIPHQTGMHGGSEERAQGSMPSAGQFDAKDSAPSVVGRGEDDATIPLPLIRVEDRPMLAEDAAAAARDADALRSIGPDEPTVVLPAGTATVDGDTVNMAGSTLNLPASTVIMRAGTVNAPVDTVSRRADAQNLDFNLGDLDMTAQHVQMPSVLHEHVVVKERRTNIVDVLRAALTREPDRHDLRLKLLELYYAAAATNRQGFLEVVQRLANERDYLSEGEWEKIAFMGRQIAAENPLFTEAAEDDDLADCA